MPRVSSSEDSMLGRDERPSLQQDARAESPAAASMHSARSPIPSAVPESPLDTPRAVKPVEDVSSVEAHRTRELKWISAMSSVPASQARKSKKIRRLVLEGVPASVRYLVWAHMTDSKSKRIPGVYGQLSKRGKVAASETIKRDAVRCFPDQPHLRDPKGPLISLLQTYLTMVPDIEYQTNLALIAGHLLLQSPEEDAFWTFVAMMGLHLRTYFSSKSVQMEADAMVFGKAVEAFNPQIAKKLFVEMSIPPLELCRTWFSSLFATTLPQEYVNRIWDVYFCEGPPFLFRIGLAILFCSRTAIESARDRTSVLSFLARPETLSLLPSDPEDLISLALAVKLKDDDVKKQRVKVEAQLKLQTQLPQRGAPRLVSSISLPRT
ncbi:RabGAP/TBC [Phellopilus nigrolimitatus]|nr:RabGAP/TBC [Phellopilus nigrolimitatus]